MVAGSRFLQVVIALTIGLALSLQAAKAKECHRETASPPDVRFVEPGQEVLEAVRRFAGAWIGGQVGQGDSVCAACPPA